LGEVEKEKRGQTVGTEVCRELCDIRIRLYLRKSLRKNPETD